MTIKRRIFSKETKFQAAMALVSEKYTLAELTQKYGVHQTVLSRWKRDFMENGANAFDRNARPKTVEKEVEGLQRKIGQLTMELDFLKKVLGK